MHAVEERKGVEVVNIDVYLRDGVVHTYTAVLPIRWDLNSDSDELMIVDRWGSAVVRYRAGYWRAAETRNPRILRDEDDASPLVGNPLVDDVRTALMQKQIDMLGERLKKHEQQVTALLVGFDELRQHLGPLLDALRKPEW